ncbi:MAG TPA: c-type cytochrome [Rhodanobacteraceae bacterium]|nr:c-type cytochrome [Rhodanobacteraceae bacterium]
MKNLMMSFAIAACGLSVAALAVAQAVALPPVESPDVQLQRVPVSGLHIGQPGQVKNPYEGNKNAWMEGKKLFNSLNCAGCHAPGGGGGMGPALSDKVWIYGNDPADIYLTIEHGRPNGMPQWGTTLPPQAIWALVTYVETLSQPNPEFEPVTKLGSTSAPGNTPHPPGKLEPPPMPKQEKPAPQTPKSPHPAPPTHPKPPSTSGGRP